MDPQYRMLLEIVYEALENGKSGVIKTGLASNGSNECSGPGFRPD